MSVRIDPHVKVLDEAVVRRAKRAGLDGLVYAPHFTRLPAIRERAAAFSEEDFAVVPGREVFTGTWRDRKHVLAVGLEEPVPDFVTLEGAMREFERQDAVVLVPHPAFATVSLSAADLRAHRDRIHAAETYNPKHLAFHNRRAERISADLGLPAFGSSYAHLPGTVGEVWTEFGAAEPTPAGIVDALGSDRSRSVGHRSGFAHRFRRAAEVAHLFYENSISKAYLLSKGAKPTNPHHPAYDDRFNDVAVYDPPAMRTFQA